MRRCKRIRRAERRKIRRRSPPAGARRFRRYLSVARAQGFPEGRGRRIAKFGFGKNEVKFGEFPSFGISRKGRSEAFARDLQSSRSFAAEECGTLRKDCQNVSMRRGKIEGGRAPPCAQCVFCVRAHRLREAIGRHVRRVRTCRYGGFASGGAAAAWRDIAARSSPACHCAANISRNSGKDARKPAFRGLSAAVGVRIFFGRRKPAGFSRSGAQVGENALQAFSERAAAAFRLRAFLSRDKDWSFRDGGRLGDFAPDF